MSERRQERLRRMAVLGPSKTKPVPPKGRVIEYRRPWLYPKQEQFLFTEARYSVVEASTKTGKTTGCLFWLWEMACLLGAPGRHFWWVAPIYRQAQIAYDRTKVYTRHLESWLHFNDSEMSVRLPNGAKVWFKSAENPDSLYGEDVYAAVLDEATRMREASFVAMRTTLTATRGPMRIIGNVKGTKNWAYRIARRAQAGEPGFFYAKLTAWDAVDAGILPREEVEDAKRLLTEEVFNELYLAEASEDGSNPFGMSHIRACKVPQLSGKPVVVWGWDLAKSVDWTVGIGLDRDGQMAAFERFQRPWPETRMTIQRLVAGKHALIDSTGVGDPVVQEMQRLLPDVEGYHFSATSKQQLMEKLAMGIQGHEVGIWDHPVVVSELESFEYEVYRTGVRYSAPEGMHDDCVCSLALAWMAYDRRVKHAPTGRVRSISPV